MREMTRSAWLALPADRKLRKDVQRGLKLYVEYYVLGLDPATQATVLVPVHLIGG